MVKTWIEMKAQTQLRASITRIDRMPGREPISRPTTFARALSPLSLLLIGP